MSDEARKENIPEGSPDDAIKKNQTEPISKDWKTEPDADEISKQLDESEITYAGSCDSDPCYKINTLMHDFNSLNKGEQAEVKKRLQVVPRISTWWYILPVFLGILGGVFAYFGLRDRDKFMAKVMVKVGIMVSAPTLIFWGLILIGAGLLA